MVCTKVAERADKTVEKMVEKKGWKGMQLAVLMVETMDAVMVAMKERQDAPKVEMRVVSKAASTAEKTVERKDA